jgi:threonine/homoserine/homoserine lactone efflux protein
MMDSIAPFVTYALALGIAGAIPGPGVAAVVGRSLHRHDRHAAAFILGIAIGDVVFLTIAVLGLSSIAQLFSGVFTMIKTAGGLYLLYLAWKFFTAPVEGALELKLQKGTSWTAIAAGCILTLSNPKVIVFYMALLPNIVDLQAITLTGWAALALLTMAVLFAVLLPYSIAAARARDLLYNSKARRKLNVTAATIVGGVGLMMLLESVRTR